ncbi:hypothetical protein M5K25_001491 [Dendrobium thyrsiflorum]|uniref:Uncharacterized protein n=1 Tax=Dendrobium thyrsiflorum TaxID=117978 RepID=A0ABD0W224_DENTH
MYHVLIGKRLFENGSLKLTCSIGGPSYLLVYLLTFAKIDVYTCKIVDNTKAWKCRSEQGRGNNGCRQGVGSAGAGIKDQEMFRWQRPDDFPPGETSEAAIWDAIDRQDSQGDADVRNRLEQYYDMMRGSFTRSPLLPECPPKLVEFGDPIQWVNSLRLQCGEYHPLESSIAPVSWGTYDILEPTADTVEPVVQLAIVCTLGVATRLYSWTGLEPDQRLRPLGPLRTSGTQRYLQTTEIYEVVYASLFDYGRLVEFWDAGRGTCWIGVEEFTVTLSDLQIVFGLPVFGHHFKECRVPSADGDRRGRSVLPDVYPVALQHYRQTYRASDLS